MIAESIHTMVIFTQWMFWRMLNVWGLDVDGTIEGFVKIHPPWKAYICILRNAAGFYFLSSFKHLS